MWQSWSQKLFKKPRDQNEKRCLNAVEENDVQTLQKILKNPVDYRLGGKSILSVAVAKSSCDVIRFLIDNGCDVRQIDNLNDENVWHLFFRLLRECAHESHELSCASCKIRLDRLEISDILFNAYKDDVEALFVDIFLKKNQAKMTPFLFACHAGCDTIIVRFLSLIENRLIDKSIISIDKLIGYSRNNVFHFLLSRSTYYMPLARLDTVKAVIDKIPFSNQLIDMKNDFDQTPLYSFLFYHWHDWKNVLVVELAKLFLTRGASPDTIDSKDGRTFLELAIYNENAPLVEVLLRAGCRTDPCDRSPHSPMFYILKYRWRYWKSLIRVIELFLAFGVDLQKELYLYEIDERPMEFTSPKYAKLRDTRNMDPNIVQSLKELRRSNQMLSLQRQCRNKIRRLLKGKADEVIRNLPNVPDRIKSYLLVENEKRVLGISD